MKKIIVSFVAVASIFAGSFGTWAALPVLAYSPTLSIYSNGQNSGTVIFDVSGAQPNTEVTIYYYTTANPGQAIVAGTFGTTDYSGSFSASEPYGNDAQNGVTGRYAVIGNDSTNTVSSSSYSYGGGQPINGQVTFSNNNPILTLGQSQTISVYDYNNGNYGSYYISSNSNSSIVSATISGSILTLYGLESGSSSIMVCSYSTGYGYGSQCGTLYVTVNGNPYGGGSITFAQSNVSLTTGQSYSDAIYNNTGTYNNGYVVSSNSNSAAVSATVSGSSLQLYGLANGTSTITICSSSSYGYNGQCGTLYVTVTGYGTAGTIVASPSNPYITYGQNLEITLSQTVYNGYSNGFYISSNTNPNIVSASISGNILTVYGLSYGTDVVTVCGNNTYTYNSNNCLAITITVNSTGGGNGQLTFAEGNVSLTAGQSYSDAVYNVGNYYAGTLYIESNTNGSVASAVISGTSVLLYGNETGNTTVEVCSTNTSGYGGVSCGYVYVYVSGYSTGPTGTVTFSNADPTVTVGQSTTINLYANNSYGTVGSFYIATNPNTSVVSAFISGSTLQLNGVSVGNATLSVCASTSSSPECGNLYVTVTGNGQVLGATTYRNGQLIQEGQQISIVYRNTKTPFGNWAAFTGFGFKSYNVLNVGESNLPQSGHVISSAYGTHPWGTWVKNGNTVYFVSEYGLIPVPDYGTFINNGGQDAWVVQANSFDLQLPLQSVMVYNDSRLQ